MCDKKEITKMMLYMNTINKFVQMTNATLSFFLTYYSNENYNVQSEYDENISVAFRIIHIEVSNISIYLTKCKRPDSHVFLYYNVHTH